ncbi:MAG: sigma-54 dependent transcriptional regulator [Methylotetracoccus sp.]
MPNSLLIIEDEALLGAELSRHYRKGGWDVEWSSTLAEAGVLLRDKGLDPLVVLSDMNLPDGNALDFMESQRDRASYAEWLFLTGYGSVPDSVRALRIGAYDFLEKPCELERLDLIVSSAARSASAHRRLLDQAQQSHQRYSPSAYVGASAAAQQVRELLARLTQVAFSALIIGGETGTGKGLAARILHYGGKRSQGPLIELNCAALPRELLESQLFGHELGAFTGAVARHRGLIEQADGGTLFLDEIGEMPLDLQSKLLKALEDRKFRRLGSEKEISVDVQIIAASNRDLAELSKTGQFRSDLYHRLSVFRLQLPALRSVKEDLKDLVPLLVAEFNASSNRQVRQIPTEVWQQLDAYDWPGNVRELRNVIERCVLLSDGPVFPVQWLQLPGVGATPIAGAGGVADDNGLRIPLDGSMALDDMDCYIIRTVLDRYDGNVTAAARALGTTRETLRYRVRKYGLSATV